MLIKKLKNEYITTTNYWGYSGGKSIETNSFKKILKRIINGKILSFLNLKLVSANEDLRPEQKSLVTTDKVIKKRNEFIADNLIEYFSRFNLNLNSLEIQKDISSYDILFRSSDISSLNGGMGYNNGLITFIICKYIQPSTIIESGVWRGYTTYLLEKASPKNMKMSCYDINLKTIEYYSKNADYFEMDISENNEKDYNDYDLAFFDDHVSHYDRLHFCNNNNIKFVILDDDVSIYQVHSDGWPPIPSASMVFDYPNICQDFEWVINGIDAKANIKNLNIEPIIDNYTYVPYPDLSVYTGYKDTSYSSLLIKISEDS